MGIRRKKREPGSAKKTGASSAKPGKEASVPGPGVLSVRRMRLEDLKPAPYNEDIRGIDDEAMAGLTTSVRKFGCVEPVVWNRRFNWIVGGHQRVRALRALGAVECDVSVVDLDERDDRLLNYTLNNRHIAGDFVGDAASVLEGLSVEVPEFGELRLDALLNELDGVQPSIEGLTDPDVVSSEPEEPICKPGDLWQLGKHRLLCGDATDAADVVKVMAGEKAVLVATDPPYLVDYTGMDRPKDSGKDWSDTYHEIGIKDAEAFLEHAIGHAVEHAVEHAAWYWWYAHKRQLLIERIWEKYDILLHQVIIWVKPAATLGYSLYRWQHEPCLFGWRKGHKPAHDGKSSYTTVWELDWEGKGRVVGNEHPTQKPVEIFARPMRKHTKMGDICYEPFSGSGSQIIAAETLGRRCFGMEIEPKYCDVAIRRWENFTGKKARKLKGCRRSKS